MSATVRLVRRRFAYTAAGVRYAVWIWPAAMAKSAGFIHIHHLIPLSGIKQDYRLNPETDLIPVCPNCHAMLHRRDPPFTPEELKARLRPAD
nr:Predicted restriction endonuclease [Klebsiella pneumoniae]